MLRAVLGHKTKTPMTAPAIVGIMFEDDDGVGEGVDGGGEGALNAHGSGGSGGGGGEGGPNTSAGVLRSSVVPSPSWP